MKYIKQYEKIISAKSEEAKRNPLYDFSGRLLKIVRAATKGIVDPKFLIANRYIQNDGYITIRCQEKGSAPFFKITLDYDERLDGGKGTMVVRSTKHTQIYKIKHFFNFISEQLDPYIVAVEFNDNYFRLNFSLKDTDDIIKSLEEYYMYLASNKFNI